MKKNILTLVCIGIIALGCKESSDISSPGSSSTGKGGSMARFTIVADKLYAVDNRSINVFDISNAKTLDSINKQDIGFNIETIFANGKYLYLGSQDGMYIFDLTDPSYPNQLSKYQHIRSCDPVVANDTVAYVTLHAESFCGRSTNELQVVNIKNKQQPKFESSLPMTKPLGLGIDGKTLFVCDNGLKIYTLTDPYHPTFKKYFNIPAYDVIPDDNLLLVLANDGLHQYSYQNDTIKYLSHIK